MLNLPTFASLASLACLTFSVLFLTRLKKLAPMTSEEAKTLWQIHLNQEHCPSKKWKKITRKHSVVGFECECGTKQMQKRPLI